MQNNGSLFSQFVWSFKLSSIIPLKSQVSQPDTTIEKQVENLNGLNGLKEQMVDNKG